MGFDKENRVSTPIAPVGRAGGGQRCASGPNAYAPHSPRDEVPSLTAAYAPGSGDQNLAFLDRCPTAVREVALAVETVVEPERTYLLSLGSQQGNAHLP